MAARTVIHRGRTYLCSEYDGSWWQVYPWDKPDRFIGHEQNLPKELQRKLRLRCRRCDEYMLRKRCENPKCLFYGKYAHEQHDLETRNAKA